MSWQHWAEQLRNAPEQAVNDLLRGAADIGPFERVSPHEFLLAVLPRKDRSVSRTLLGEPDSGIIEAEQGAGLCDYLDIGLSAWLRSERDAPLPSARKFGAYSARVCEAMQWPLFFMLPRTQATLRTDRAIWLQWLRSLTLSAFRDPEYDYWQVLAAQQADNQLQFFWQSFAIEAGRTRSTRYLNLGLLALAKLPLSEEDSLRNLRLQVQALVSRYQHRKNLGVLAQEELAHCLNSVMVRNPSLSAAHYRDFLATFLTTLGNDKAESVLRLLGFSSTQGTRRYASTSPRPDYGLKPPGQPGDTDQVIESIRHSKSLLQAWQAIHRLISAHEDFLHKSGDAYHFLRVLDRGIRVLSDKYPLNDPEIQSRVFHWIRLALRLDPDEPRRWMLWELVLRRTDQPQRAQWVLWEMTRRFPENVHCRLELARLLAESSPNDALPQAHHLLQQVLQLDSENLHALSTLAQMAIRREDWPQALELSQKGLQIDPSDAACTLLLASAYARRGKQGDLQTAVEQLQRYNNRYSTNKSVENYIRRLQKRLVQGSSWYIEDEKPKAHEIVVPETDPAWLGFVESIRSWSAALTTGVEAELHSDDAQFIDRVLPLPLALRQALAKKQLDSDVLSNYEAATQLEFPLETSLWRYLQTLNSIESSPSDRNRAKKAVQARIEFEARDAEREKSSWSCYLTKEWNVLNSSDDSALATGTKWLKELLGRYQPLPAPLFA